MEGAVEVTVVEMADSLLRALYEDTGGDTNRVSNVVSLARNIDLTDDQLDAAMSFLTDRGLLEVIAIGGMCRITAFGVDVVEHETPNMQREADRWSFLKLSFDLAQGNPMCFLNIWDTGGALEWDRDRTTQTYDYLHEKGFLQARTIGGGYSVTSAAADVIERAIQNPDQKTDFFPPLSSLVIHIKDSFQNSTIVNSIIGSPNAHITSGDISLGYPPDQQRLLESLEAIRKAVVESPGLSSDQKSEAVADIESARTQIRKKEPNRSVIKAVWESLWPTLDKLATESVVAAAVEVIKSYIGVP